MKRFKLITCVFLSVNIACSSQKQINFYENFTYPFKCLANMYTAGFGTIFSHDQRTENSFSDALQSNPVIPCFLLYNVKHHNFANLLKIKNVKILIVCFSFLGAQTLFEPEAFENEKLIDATKNLALTPLKLAKNSFYGDMYHTIDGKLKTFEEKRKAMFSSEEEKNFYDASLASFYTLIPSLYFGMHKCYIFRFGLGISALAPFLSFLYENYKTQ